MSFQLSAFGTQREEARFRSRYLIGARLLCLPARFGVGFAEVWITRSDGVVRRDVSGGFVRIQWDETHRLRSGSVSELQANVQVS